MVLSASDFHYKQGFEEESVTKQIASKHLTITTFDCILNKKAKHCLKHEEKEEEKLMIKVESGVPSLLPLLLLSSSPL